MNLTNIRTILRQIGANGGSGWGLPDDIVSEEEVAASMHGKRIIKALEKYRSALISIGRPATVREIADAAGSTASSANYFIKAHPEWFNRIEVPTTSKMTYLIELRVN
jgi:hypothetical protein